MTYNNEHPQILCSDPENTWYFDALIGYNFVSKKPPERKVRELTAHCKAICARCPALEACMTVEAPREHFDRGVVAGMSDARRAAKYAEGVA